MYTYYCCDAIVISLFHFPLSRDLMVLPWVWCPSVAVSMAWSNIVSIFLISSQSSALDSVFIKCRCCYISVDVPLYFYTASCRIFPTLVFGKTFCCYFISFVGSAVEGYLAVTAVWSEVLSWCLLWFVFDGMKNMYSMCALSLPLWWFYIYFVLFYMFEKFVIGVCSISC